MSGEWGEATGYSYIGFGFCDNVLGRNRRGMLNLEVPKRVLLFCRLLFFLLFFVGFFRAVRFGHLGRGMREKFWSQ